ncbi:MAG: MBL fold metallo-hydrolase [Muribaculaceae bacterium]|nr:MBL fold metallo-hydrolase [Muribaculaceae bacterium]
MACLFAIASLTNAACAQHNTASPEADVFTTPGGNSVTFHPLIHASLRISFNGCELQIDPVSKLGDRAVDFYSMPKADFILVTHEHFDHCDSTAIASLSADRTKLITNARCASILGNGEIMANGDRMRLNRAISVEAVPAYNTTPEHLQFHPKGRDNGFILNIDGLRIYIAGDTEDIPEMAGLGHIDVAFLPCNQPYTMTVNQLLRAARMVKPTVLIPYHYGTTDINSVPDALAPSGIEVRLHECLR